MSDNLIYQIIEVVTVVFEIFIVQQYISSFFDMRAKIRHAFFGYFLFGVGLALLSLFSKQPIILAIFSVVGVLSLEFRYYNGNGHIKFFSAFFFGVLMIGIEILCLGLVSMLGEINIENIQVYGPHRAIFIATAKIVQILIVKILGVTVKWRVTTNDKIEIKGVFFLIICQIISVMLLYNIFINAYRTATDLTVPMIFSIFGIMYINLIVFWYFDRIKFAYEYRHEKELAEAKFKYQREYYELLEEHQQETEALWHDMKKHMSAIKELYDMDFKSDTEQYINILDNKINAIPKMVRTSIPAINAILSDEFRKAQRENIEIRLDVNITQPLKINTFDLCVLLGNTIENSIDACCKLPNETERFIEVSILQYDSVLLIELKNPYISASNNVSNRSRKHGYGLKNVRKVLEKYGGDIEIIDNDKIYHISLIIP